MGEHLQIARYSHSRNTGMNIPAPMICPSVQVISSISLSTHIQPSATSKLTLPHKSYASARKRAVDKMVNLSAFGGHFERCQVVIGKTLSIVNGNVTKSGTADVH